jgi:hypothetical protein
VASKLTISLLGSQEKETLKGWLTMLITALGNWEKSVPRGHVAINNMCELRGSYVASNNNNNNDNIVLRFRIFFVPGLDRNLKPTPLPSCDRRAQDRNHCSHFGCEGHIVDLRGTSTVCPSHTLYAPHTSGCEGHPIYWMPLARYIEGRPIYPRCNLTSWRRKEWNSGRISSHH